MFSNWQGLERMTYWKSIDVQNELHGRYNRAEQKQSARFRGRIVFDLVESGYQLLGMYSYGPV